MGSSIPPTLSSLGATSGEVGPVTARAAVEVQVQTLTWRAAGGGDLSVDHQAVGHRNGRKTGQGHARFNVIAPFQFGRDFQRRGIVSHDAGGDIVVAMDSAASAIGRRADGLGRPNQAGHDENEDCGQKAHRRLSCV